MKSEKRTQQRIQLLKITAGLCLTALVVALVLHTFPLSYRLFLTSEIPQETHEFIPAVAYFPETFYTIEYNTGKTVPNAAMQNIKWAYSLGYKGVAVPYIRPLEVEFKEAAARGMKLYAVFTNPVNEIQTVLQHAHGVILEEGLDPTFKENVASFCSIVQEKECFGDGLASIDPLGVQTPYNTKTVFFTPALEQVAVAAINQAELLFVKGKQPQEFITSAKWIEFYTKLPSFQSGRSANLIMEYPVATDPEETEQYRKKVKVQSEFAHHALSLAGFDVTIRENTITPAQLHYIVSLGNRKFHNELLIDDAPVILQSLQGIPEEWVFVREKLGIHNQRSPHQVSAPSIARWENQVFDWATHDAKIAALRAHEVPSIMQSSLYAMIVKKDNMYFVNGDKLAGQAVFPLANIFGTMRSPCECIGKVGSDASIFYALENTQLVFTLSVSSLITVYKPSGEIKYSEVADDLDISVQKGELVIAHKVYK